MKNEVLRIADGVINSECCYGDVLIISDSVKAYCVGVMWGATRGAIRRDIQMATDERADFYFESQSGSRCAVLRDRQSARRPNVTSMTGFVLSAGGIRMAPCATMCSAIQKIYCRLSMTICRSAGRGSH